MRLVFLPMHPDDVRLAGLSPIAEDSVPGILLDDGGFPACLHGAEGRIHGTVHSIMPDDEAEARDVLRALDLLHGAPGSHVRTIAMASGNPVHAWLWIGPVDRPAVDGGRWQSDRLRSAETDRDHRR